MRSGQIAIDACSDPSNDPVACKSRFLTFTGSLGGLRRFGEGWSIKGELSAAQRTGDAAYAHVDNVRLPLGLTSDPKGPSPQLYYRVADIEEAIARVRANGGGAEPVWESKSGRGASCRDDQGVAFSLWEPAPGF